MSHVTNIENTTIKIKKIKKRPHNCEKCKYVSYYDNRTISFYCYQCNHENFINTEKNEEWNTHFSKKRIRNLKKKYGKDIVLTIC
jgi:hypothetical protein